MVPNGERGFPEPGWYDHVGPVFEMWLPQILSFAAGNSDCCRLRFLDADAQVTISRRSDGDTQALCLWEHGLQISEGKISVSAFLDSVLYCLRYLHRECYLHKMNFPFDDQLRKLTQLNKQEKNYV